MANRALIMPIKNRSVYSRWQHRGKAMSDSIYRASKIKVDGTPGYLAVFRHPCRRDDEGNWGLEIEATLGTGIDEDADELLGQLNELISNRAWWKADQRKNAAERFSIPVVKAFYDDIETVESVDLRERYIPLPTRDDGYAKIMLVGTTGAGKTTLLRHIIGSHPTRDGFPSTSANRTTTADIEVVTSSEGPYETLITFISKESAIALIEECVQQACLVAINDESDDQIADKLLSDQEQRFRLSYSLGTWQDEDDGSDWDSDEVDTEILIPDSEADGSNINHLRDYVNQVKEMTKIVETKIANQLGALSTQEKPSDKESWLKLFDEGISSEIRVGELVGDIVADIQSRIDAVEVGEFAFDTTGWPVMWRFASGHRENFLDEIRPFTGIHWRHFGKLLTPLVDGIRVRWRLDSVMRNLPVADKLVLIDGQGLGHAASSSISPHITERFSDMDMILLVDSAKQPMLSSPSQLLHSVGISGHTHKLALAFTHCDEVKGPNLRSAKLKRNHIMSSVNNVVSSLRNDLGDSVANTLNTQIDRSVFFLGGLNKALNREGKSYFASELNKLLIDMQASSEPRAEAEASPRYTSDGLEDALKNATDGFHRLWRNYLISSHWAQIKALSRRFAEHHIFSESERYQYRSERVDLAPIGDLVGQLQRELHLWLRDPNGGWVIAPDTDEDAQESISGVWRSVYSKLHSFSRNRLATREIGRWENAYEFRGTGSTVDRRKKIKFIYQRAAPVIESDNGEEVEDFMREMYSIVREAIEDNGGQFRE